MKEEHRTQNSSLCITAGYVVNYAVGGVFTAPLTFNLLLNLKLSTP